MPNQYQQYKQQSVSTMTAGELLITLFDEVVKRVRQGIIAIEDKDLTAAHNSLVHAQDIIRYLKATLDDQFNIVVELDALYDYFYDQLVAANISKNAQVLEDLLPLLVEMRNTWKQAEKLSRMKQGV